ncbi:calmodulin-regulated spectrin-associated protein 1-like isoform X4 [Lytechinus variegatus]|uniref:calmodulin-regulated spectrin-associated protein 1-like isoform X4 n=1 Tax=Lytechinus variegatus TaxID=7654 RepID=UPI001BB18FBA|nr:calmodulin-regulated spectrin-associated protein 1-like isoform X4 [Lytechinus variegatus]
MDSIPEVIPMRSYNFRKAKLNSSVAWLLSKAYSDREEPPADLLDPLYQDNGEDHVKPSVIYQLASGELYSRVCSNIFPPTIHPWDGHVAIIQGFSRRGIHVVDDRNQPVTESILSQTQKIKLCESLPRAFKLLNAHVAMMDAIMKAYVNETISVENVVQAVRKFTTFNASSELPFDLEDALRFWINKVCLAVEHQVERDRKTHQANIMQSAAPAIRVKRDQVQPKEMLHFPKMNDMMKDLSDGCCLATIIHHYYPHLLSLEDVALHESMSFADSLHNLQVVTSFFQRNLPHLLHFTLEDLLYCHESMKYNIVALVAEMFWCFEVEKPSHLEANQGGIQSSAFTQMNTPLNMAARPPIPISDATKRSFHAPSPKAEMQSVDLTKVPSSPNSQRRLLNRQQQERSSIFGDTPGDENTPPSEYQNRSLQRSISREQQKQHPGSQSILAWEEKEKEERRTPDTATFTRPRRLQESPTVNMQSSRAGSLLANVSIDSEMNESQDFSGLDIEINPLPERMGSPNTQGQQHSEDRLMTLTHQRPVTQEGQLESEDLEVESLTSSRMSRQQGGFGETKESFNPMLTHRTDPVMNGVDGSQGATSSPGTFRGSQREHLDSAMSPASEAGSVDSSISRKNLKLDVHPVDILGSPRGPTNEFMPAVVRPLKEKSHQVRKTDERGDHLRHRNKHRSGDTRMTAAHQQYPDQGSDSSESVDATTPLSGESIADSLAGDLALQRARIARGVGPGGFMLAPASQSNQPQMAKGKHGEAFFISGSEQPLQDDGHHSFNAPTGAKSFTISEGAMTVDDAKEAGIPVVSASRSMQGLSEQGFRMRPGGMTSSQSDQEIYQPRPQHSHSFQNPVSSAAAPSSLPYSMHDSYSNPHNPHQYQPNPQFNPQSSNPQHANPHHGNPHHGNPHSNPHGNPHHDFRTHSPHHHISQPNPYDQQIDPEAYAHDQHGVSTWGHHQKQQQQQFHPHSTNPGMSQSFTNHSSTPANHQDVESPKLTAETVQSEHQDKRPVVMDFSHNLSPVQKENGYCPSGEKNTPVTMSHSGAILTQDHINHPSPVHSHPTIDQLSGSERPSNMEHHNSVEQNRNSYTNPHTFAADVENFHSNQSAFREPANHSMTTWSAKPKQSPNTEFPTTSTFSVTPTNTGAAGNGYHISSGETTKAGDGSVSSSELTHIRLRLEEKRRLMDYERHKLERQWNKQRQRVGKAAFLQVLANKKQEKEGNGEGYSRSEHQRNIENARPPQGLTTFAALSANREKTSQVSQEPPVSEQEQYQHPIQDKQLTQAYFLAQQNQMSQQTAQKTPRNQQPPPEHRAQQPSPSHLNQVQMAEGGRRSNESPRSGRDSESPRMRSESPGPRRTESPGSSSGSHSPHLTQEEYNTSLEKLNANLSQLQNQILRLSLQQEEFKKGMNESPRQVQESPRQVAQGDFGDQRDSPEHRDVHRPPSHPQQDSTGQMTGFYIESGDQKLSEQDSYVLEENPAFNIPQGQGISPQEMQHIQQSPQGFSLLPHNQPIDNFNEKQTVNAQRLSDVTYIKSEMNDNKYIIPDNLEHDAVVANAQIERTFSGQNLNIDNENQSQLKQMPTEEVHSPPANQRKGQPVMAFDIDMGSPKQPRAPPANQRKKEATPKKVQEKKSSPPRTPVKKQAPPSVYEIVGEGEEDVPVPSDMVVRPLEQLNASKDDDSADTSGMAAGFIIGEDDKAQDELAKRKEMFLKARLKREEEAKIKKASREAEAERKREELRKKQEEAEMKKAEQAARREQIRLEYQRKKQAELDPDSAPPPPRKQKSSRPRPKSQMVTSDKGPSHSHGYTALDSASDIALSVQKKSYTIESSSEGEIAGAVTGAAAGAAAAQGSENQTSASAPSTQGETPHPPPQGSAAAPPQSSATPQSASQAADQGTKKSPSSSGKPMPEAAKRRPPSPRPRSNTLPGSLRSPEKTSPQNAPQIQAPESGASVMSPQEGAVANVSPSVASQESSGSGGSQAADYSGPKLFVKPTSKSNRHIIINAISHCILAGVVNEKTKDKVLQEIAKSDQKHFMILFRDHSLQFRSLYGFTPESEELTKVYGTGPRHITNKMTEALYKYNSGGKHFAKVPSKSLSVQIDGITINSAFWQSKRPVSTKKH